ncbi:MAG TPA: hypothetical protein VJO35_04435 [Terriglobales bacterium]|nr:hypothetical protein [Terriglobales bacterium]
MANQSLNGGIETDKVLENLRRASGLEKLHADLVKYREILRSLASLSPTITSNASLNLAFTQWISEKVRAVDILVGSNGTPTGTSLDAGRAANSSGPQTPTQQVKEFSPESAPDLRHTRVLFARFGSTQADGWNKLVHVAHVEAFLRLKSFDALKAATSSNMMKGRPGSEDTKKGYRYVPEIDVSIQNVDAAHALSNTLRLAKYLRVDLTIDFEWMDKPDAAHPGTQGRIEWKP